MSNEELVPDVENVNAEPTEQQETGQSQEAEKSETTEASETTEKSVEEQTDAATPDEGSKDVDSKWIGRRLERAKAAERSKANVEIAALREENERLKTSHSTNVNTNVNTVTTDKPRMADFQDLETFTESLTDWKLEQKFKQVSANTTQQKTIETYQSRAKELVKTIPDFESVVTTFINDYSAVQIPELTTIALESEHGPKLMHYLATHESDMERIIELPSHRRLIELGKLEDKIGNVKAPEPVVLKKAPAPVTPEKGGSSARKALTDPTLSQAEYRQQRMAQRKGRF